MRAVNSIPGPGVAVGQTAAAQTLAAPGSTTAVVIVHVASELHLLLIEDNASDADLFLEHLDDVHGPRLRISHVTSLEQALARLGQARDVDIIVLDLVLPDAEGIVPIERIHRVAPRIPIVVLSGIADEELGQRAIQAGAQDFLHKDDFHAASLARSLRYATERARLQNQFRALVEHNADALVVIDSSGVVTYLNQAAEALFGRAHHEMKGRPFGFPLTEGAISELQIEQPDAEPRAAEMRVAPITWEGQAAWLASIRDVTDRKRAEELQRRLHHADRLASIGQLASGVAHEINNPAGFILGNLEVLDEHLLMVERACSRIAHAAHTRDLPAIARLRSDLDTVVREMHGMLADSMAGIERIARIVKTLSSFARIDHGEVERVDINEIVETACKITHNEIRHRALLDRDLGSLPPIVADPGKLVQVFTNLLINAAQSITPGAAESNRVRVSTRHRDGQIVIRVEDTGCGIPAENLERIFEPFFTTKIRGLGTGLGLPLSSDIVRKHGGHMRVSSTVGQGTVFEIALPTETGMIIPAPPPPAIQAAPSQGRRARVLVVDDESMLLDTFQRMLRRDHDVVLVEGGTRAVAELERNSAFDAVICDLMMPDLDGMQLYRILCERWPALRRRIIFCSGGAFDAGAREFLERARHEHVIIEKPVKRDEVLAAVRRVLDDRVSVATSRTGSQ
jgi:two-component system cell cycle sensor histidine kinase/response regulator CckA